MKINGIEPKKIYPKEMPQDHWSTYSDWTEEDHKKVDESISNTVNKCLEKYKKLKEESHGKKKND